MISYTTSLPELHALIAGLGKVYENIIPGSSHLLEEAETSYEKLYEKYQVIHDSLRRIYKQIIPQLKYGPSDYFLMQFVVSEGHLEVLRVLKDGSLGYICPWNERTIAHAVENGNLEILRALRDGSLGGVCPWDERATIYAAAYNQLEILRTLRDGSLGSVCRWDVRATMYAAENGHLEVLRALRDGSLGGVCPWNESTTAWAALEGHLEVLRALRDGSLGGKCPWNKEACKCYARNYPHIIALIDSGELD